MDYSGFGVIAVAAIQELLEKEKAANTEMQAQNAALLEENQEMKKMLNSFLGRLEALEIRLSGSEVPTDKLKSNLSLYPGPKVASVSPQ